MIAPAHLDHAERDAVRAFDRAIRRFHLIAANVRIFGELPRSKARRRLLRARVAVEEACIVANAATVRHTRWILALGRARIRKPARWFA